VRDLLLCAKHLFVDAIRHPGALRAHQDGQYPCGLAEADAPAALPSWPRWRASTMNRGRNGQGRAVQRVFRLGLSAKVAARKAAAGTVALPSALGCAKAKKKPPQTDGGSRLPVRNAPSLRAALVSAKGASHAMCYTFTDPSSVCYRLSGPSHERPHHRLLVRDDFPDFAWEGERLEFRLTWQGQLLADTTRDGAARRSRAEHKQKIRQGLHPQLKRLWANSPFLSKAGQPGKTPGTRIFATLSAKNSTEGLANRFSMFGYRFVPLVVHELDLLCSVDILFLRLGEPGHMISRAGDVDNRLKTIFDALCLPRNASQLGPYTSPGPDEDPFFCLFQDDSLITKASVETDVLLQPTSNPPNPSDVHLVITVRLRPGRITAENVGFG
jgi:hypothetical protein